MSNQLAIPTVRRVATRHGTHVEPPLDPKWSKSEKLAWHAAVFEFDTGMSVAIEQGTLQERHLGIWRTVADSYSIGFGSSTMGSLNYHDAWTYISGLETGVMECRNSHGDNVFDPNMW